jgi:hypothetical protein
MNATRSNTMKNETYLGLNVPTIHKSTDAETEAEIDEWAGKLREARKACDDAHGAEGSELHEIQDAYQNTLKTVQKNFLRGDRKEIIRRSR